MPHFASHVPGRRCDDRPERRPSCDRDGNRDDDRCRPRRPKHPCKHKSQGRSKKKHCR